MADHIEIDGSHGEGGGQIVRTALTLSSITGKPFKITNIRSGRPNPGLQPQHLMACKAVRSVCRGKLEGAEEGSGELIFTPGGIIGGKYDFDIGTAGSITLVAQAILPMLFSAKKESFVRITGGTHVMKSPSYDYFAKVFVPAIKEFGGDVGVECRRTGYYPKGGGIVELEVKPSKLKAAVLARKEEEIRTIIRLGNLPLGIAMREKKAFMEKDWDSVRIIEEETYSPGNAITTWRGYTGAYSLGAIGKRAEIVAKEAIDAMEKEKESDVDMHLADQLMIYAALAEGRTGYLTSEITSHAKTNAEIIAKFVERKISFSGNMIEVA